MQIYTKMKLIEWRNLLSKRRKTKNVGVIFKFGVEFDADYVKNGVERFSLLLTATP